MLFKKINLFVFNDCGLPSKSRILIYKVIIGPIFKNRLYLCKISITKYEKTGKYTALLYNKISALFHSIQIVNCYLIFLK